MIKKLANVQKLADVQKLQKLQSLQSAMFNLVGFQNYGRVQDFR
jgi:hypothetical protein